MSPELFALIRRYLLMSMVLALGGIVASVWANHDRQPAPSPPTAPLPGPGEAEPRR